MISSLALLQEENNHLYEKHWRTTIIIISHPQEQVNLLCPRIRKHKINELAFLLVIMNIHRASTPFLCNFLVLKNRLPRAHTGLSTSLFPRKDAQLLRPTARMFLLPRKLFVRRSPLQKGHRAVLVEETKMVRNVTCHSLQKKFFTRRTLVPAHRRNTLVAVRACFLCLFPLFVVSLPCSETSGRNFYVEL